LGEYLIRGIETNIAFDRAIIADQVFRQGNATTSFIEDFLRRTPVEAFTVQNVRA
jgi:acetyl-CoA carboxylase biotin carboxylase subunit